MTRRRKLTAAVFVAIDRRVDPREARQRMAERDERERNDTRSEVQRYLGLAQRDLSPVALRHVFTFNTLFQPEIAIDRPIGDALQPDT